MYHGPLMTVDDELARLKGEWRDHFMNEVQRAGYPAARPERSLIGEYRHPNGVRVPILAPHVNHRCTLDPILETPLWAEAPYESENTPMTNTLRAARDKVETAESRLVKARAKLAELRAAAEPLDARAVIRFSVRFEARGTRYDYAAIRTGSGRWFTTGSTCPRSGYSWSQLLAFIEGERATDIVRMIDGEVIA